MKKVLAFVLALTMVASFAACGGSDKESADQGSETVGTSAE